MRTRFIYVIALLMITVVVVAGEELPGLAGNAKYMELINNRNKLKVSVDSLSQKLDSIRKIYSIDESNRAKYRDSILTIESKLYDFRSKMAAVSSKVNLIEQEFLMKSLKSSDSEDSAKIVTKNGFNESRYLINNAFFTRNLNKTDYKALQNAQQKEAKIREFVKSFIDNYKNIKAISAKYDSASSQSVADSLGMLYDQCVVRNKQLEKALNNVWDSCYETKIYVYSYLLDRINRTDVLVRLNRMVADSRIVPANINGLNVFSTVYASFPKQQLTALNYELSLAKILNISKAIDSLQLEVDSLADVNYLMYDNVVLNRRDFVDYERVMRDGAVDYSSRNPIPYHVTPRITTIYKICVGTFSKMQPISVFRGFQPLSYEKLDDGRFRYYAGAYKDRATAEADARLLKKEGFRRPEIVVWESGVYTNLTEAESGSQTEHVIYRVEISGLDSSMSNEIKAIIEQYAPGKEISRIETDGVFTYLIGNFDASSRPQAAQLMSILNKIKGIQSTITEMK